MHTYRFIISGRVQGVWYRDTIKKKAEALDITGYAKNLPDGTVEVVANLTENQIDEFCKMLEKGSFLSKVENIETGEIMPAYFETFEVRY